MTTETIDKLYLELANVVGPLVVSSRERKAVEDERRRCVKLVEEFIKVYDANFEDDPDYAAGKLNALVNDIENDYPF